MLRLHMWYEFPTSILIWIFGLPGIDIKREILEFKCGQKAIKIAIYYSYHPLTIKIVNKWDENISIHFQGLCYQRFKCGFDQIMTLNGNNWILKYNLAAYELVRIKWKSDDNFDAFFLTAWV